MIGHKTLFDYFLQLHKEKKLHHAYLFVGPKHIGKRTLAEAIASVILGVDEKKLSLHPDFRSIAQEKNEKTEKLRKNIHIQQVRDIRSFAASGPVQADYAVILVDGAELLNTHAANAFLKTLEEPHPQTVLFLTATNIEDIPDTIISRTQVFHIPLVPEDELISVVEKHTEKEYILAAAAGRPGIAVNLVEKKKQLAQYIQAKDELHESIGKPLHAKRAIIAHLFSKKEDHITGRKNIIAYLHIWQLELHRMLVLQNTQGLTIAQIVVMYDTIQSVEQLLQKNIHPRAAIDSLLLTIP